MVIRRRWCTTLFAVVLSVLPGRAVAQKAQDSGDTTDDVGKLLDGAQQAEPTPAPAPDIAPSAPASSGELKLSNEAETAAATPKDTPPSAAKSTSSPSPSHKDHSSDERGAPLWTGTARFADRYYETGVVAGPAGGLLFAGGAESVGLTGIRVLEHHGYISKILTTALVAMGQSDRHYEGSTYTDYGNYVVRTDYYRDLTPSERAAQQEQLAAAAAGQYTTEVIVYTPSLFGLNPGKTQGKGFEASMGGDVVLGFLGPLPAILTIGGWGAYLSSPVQWKTASSGQPAAPNGQSAASNSLPKNLSYAGFGGLLRLHVPVTRFADVSAEWDLNILSLWHTGAEEREKEGNLYQSPFKLGAYVHFTDRAYVQGKAILGGFGLSDGKLGGQAELGIRF